MSRKKKFRRLETAHIAAPQSPPPVPAARPRWGRRATLSVAALLVLAMGGGAWWLLHGSTRTPAPSTPPAAADYVGAAACKQCHETEFKAWAGSHHQLAMQEANASTVLGNFENARFKQFGIESRFFKRDGKFMVRTDGSGGKLADYEIRYTFGVWPLQQYLIEFPGGRYQVLGISWNAREKSEGGQRWFHLYPNERIDHRDQLH